MSGSGSNANKLAIDNLGAYLHTSLKYAVINLFKARLTRERYVEHAQTVAYAGHDTEEEIALNDLMGTVLRQLNDLPEKTRLIFQLNRLEYKSAKEISARLEIPERTVEYHISSCAQTPSPFITGLFYAGSSTLVLGLKNAFRIRIRTSGGS